VEKGTANQNADTITHFPSDIAKRSFDIEQLETGPEILAINTILEAEASEQEEEQKNFILPHIGNAVNAETTDKLDKVWPCCEKDIKENLQRKSKT
uniref:Uncharacterized protein n=1 Tax=Romanomermis culicivorax TaxID=13658 RepID=A0A915JDF4_ROMCU